MISPILPRTAYFFQHSLNDNPSNVYLGSSDSIVPEIKATNAYRSAIASFKQSGSNYRWNYPVVFTSSNASWDLYLSLHGTNMDSYSSGNRITSYIRDRYDFQWMKYPYMERGISHEVVRIINNYAYIAQSIGAVVPYKINITIPDNK
ncbi:hypothetical protein ACETAC_01855 [Aceticella autotrophica]|uniref:Uncharacterized protein n=1 Tax=Aceticella autotrophica TaxID=2755338 RepID=A0A975AWG9_9THEO|nr:hypothetical protein [Aceticella autotrophica]QSZ27673.1 hypothetical protein ACETAC_01855 [Aceticella autotrophica]